MQESPNRNFGKIGQKMSCFYFEHPAQNRNKPISWPLNGLEI